MAWAAWIQANKGLTFKPQFGSDMCWLVEQLAPSLTGTGGSTPGIVLYDDILHRHLPSHAGSCQLVPARVLRPAERRHSQAREGRARHTPSCPRRTVRPPDHAAAEETVNPAR